MRQLFPWIKIIFRGSVGSKMTITAGHNKIVVNYCVQDRCESLVQLRESQSLFPWKGNHRYRQRSSPNNRFFPQSSSYKHGPITRFSVLTTEKKQFEKCGSLAGNCKFDLCPSVSDVHSGARSQKNKVGKERALCWVAPGKNSTWAPSQRTHSRHPSSPVRVSHRR